MWTSSQSSFSSLLYFPLHFIFESGESERFRQGWIGVGRSCLYLRYRKNYLKLLSSETLKLTQGEETEEGRTNFRSGVERTTAHWRGDDGEPRIIEFLFQKLETRSFLEFPSPQEQGCKALQQGWLLLQPPDSCEWARPGSSFVSGAGALEGRAGAMLCVRWPPGLHLTFPEGLAPRAPGGGTGLGGPGRQPLGGRLT